MMQLFESLAEVPAGFGPSAVTVGKFDGVHLGHRQVLDSLRSAASERGLVPTVVTFDRNPLALFAPDTCPDPLVSNRQKIELLADAGVGATFMATFDREFAGLAPEEFVRSILVESLGAKLVLAGSDFRFGARAAGDLALLRELGESLGFQVQLIDDVCAQDGRRTSSTWVRELLEAGDVSGAAELLGRHHRIRSTVVHGEARGRDLGFPTANLDPEIEGFRPADGVYATRLHVDGEAYPAATSIGNNPTFDGVPAHRIEAYVIDRSLDLYGREVELEFVEFVRPMNRFDSVDALVAQLGRDVEQIKERLASA